MDLQICQVPPLDRSCYQMMSVLSDALALLLLENARDGGLVVLEEVHSHPSRRLTGVEVDLCFLELVEGEEAFE